MSVAVLDDPRRRPSSAKLELRPGFDLTVLANVTARDLFIEHLTWFGQLHAAEKAVSST